MVENDLLAKCRNYEKKFPMVPNDWKRYKQYATPNAFRSNIKTFWSFGVSKEIRFEDGVRRDNKNCKIYTWDPTPISLETVRRSPSHVIHTHKAYDLSENKMKFYTTDEKKRCYSLENTDPNNVVDVLEVETENLKSITKRLGNQVDLIKLDIEGRWYELCNEILDLDLPVKMVHVECEMYFGPAEQEFKKLDELVDRYKKANFKVWTNRILGGTNIELCFDRHE
jgi:FkbM family methyltransferase